MADRLGEGDARCLSSREPPHRATPSMPPKRSRVYPDSTSRLFTTARLAVTPSGSRSTCRRCLPSRHSAVFSKPLILLHFGPRPPGWPFSPGLERRPRSCCHGASLHSCQGLMRERSPVLLTIGIQRNRAHRATSRSDAALRRRGEAGRLSLCPGECPIASSGRLIGSPSVASSFIVLARASSVQMDLLRAGRQPQFGGCEPRGLCPRMTGNGLSNIARVIRTTKVPIENFVPLLTTE